MANEKLSIIIFGATGYTGKYTVKEAAKLAKEYGFTFGVAGRRKEALENVIKEFAPNFDNIPIIIADLKDEDSLNNMAKKAKVIVNCCGPYRFYGEAVIKACISNETHHVDVSGEPQYMERMQLEYNQAAKEKGVYIISACGFDSIPCDLGTIFAQDKFNGEINSIEIYLKSWTTTPVKSAIVNYGTWESAVYGLAHANELRDLRTKLYPNKLPEFTPKLKPQSIIHQSSLSNGWSTIFPGSDRSVCYRTQRFLYEKYKQRPVQVQTYMTFGSLLSIFATAFLGIIFSIMTKSKFGQNLLLKYPSFFSGGFASRDGPNPAVSDKTHFSFTFRSKGWTEKSAEPTDKHVDPPNKELITKVSGINPGYGATCIALLLSAVTILNEAEKMPDNGGVLPPGAAFGKTSLIENLNKNGLKFEVISSIDK